MAHKYFLAVNLGGETTTREVTLEEYCAAERQAGFRPKLPSYHPEYMTTPATGAFSSGIISGSIKYDPELLEG